MLPAACHLGSPQSWKTSPGCGCLPIAIAFDVLAWRFAQWSLLEVYLACSRVGWLLPACNLHRMTLGAVDIPLEEGGKSARKIHVVRRLYLQNMCRKAKGKRTWYNFLYYSVVLTFRSWKQGLRCMSGGAPDRAICSVAWRIVWI